MHWGLWFFFTLYPNRLHQHALTLAICSSRTSILYNLAGKINMSVIALCTHSACHCVPNYCLVIFCLDQYSPASILYRRCNCRTFYFTSSQSSYCLLSIACLIWRKDRIHESYAIDFISHTIYDCMFRSVNASLPYFLSFRFNYTNEFF